MQTRRVTATSVRTVYAVRHVTLADAAGGSESLKTTNEHPFHVAGKGWTAAQDLVAGDVVLSDDATPLTVEASWAQETPAGTAVYNLTVDGDHTYFVEDGAGTQDFAWVHNAAPECKLDAKLFKGQGGGQMFTRGWTQESIKDLVKSPFRTAKVKRNGEPLTDLRTGEPATAYIREDGQGVLQNDITGEVFHVSDINDPDFVTYWP